MGCGYYAIIHDMHFYKQVCFITMQKNFPFAVGDRVRLNDDEGFITFIDTQYFTLCVREWEDKNSMHGFRQCNVLIYRSYWDKVERL